MTMPRSTYVDPNESGFYHCWSRCVRRAMLCGYDRLTGKSFEHRKLWILEKLETLASSFAMDVCAYAIMSNHVHVVVRTRPEAARAWSEEEVARRWLRLAAARDSEAVSEDAIRRLAADEERIAKLRERLSNLSHFMGYLKEPIARRANREDRCTGRFWEGRFKSQRLLDEGAVLACCVYVDLNEVRAGVVEKPEDASFCSIRRRIEELEAKEGGAGSRSRNQPNWLAAVESVSLREYVDLVDWTGRVVVAGKRGAIPEHLAPILERLDIDRGKWRRQMSSPWRRVGTAMGNGAALATEAVRRGTRWVVGICDIYGHDRPEESDGRAAPT